MILAITVASSKSRYSPRLQRYQIIDKERHMDNPSLVDDEGDRQLQVLLFQARDAIFRAREQELSQYGISTVQAAVLFIIQKIGHRATPAEISRGCSDMLTEFPLFWTGWRRMGWWRELRT